MNWFLRLYPARWRERYGDELEQLVSDVRLSRSGPALAIDLIRGAVDAHVQQRFDMQTVDWRATRRGALIAVIVWLALSVEIFLSNVTFPSKTDDDALSVVVSYLCVFATLFLVGVLAARNGAGPRGQAVAGAVAGMLLGALTIATFAIVDNVWLDVVSQQQTKIDGYAASGATSMRAFINQGLIGAAVFLTIVLGVVGALLAATGGAVQALRSGGSAKRGGSAAPG
jgi:hypothetical protein